MKKLINTPTGITEIDFTAEEVIEREQDGIEAEENKVDRITKEQEQKARKDSAIAKLKALGLTEEEVKSIL